MSTTTSTETVRDDEALSIPAGFRRATAADHLAGRPNGWVGPKIHGPNLANGRPETAGILTWAPDEGLTSVLRTDIYPEDSSAAEDALDRLESMLEYAALAAESTSPSELAHAYRANDDNAYNFAAPWDGNDAHAQELVLNASGEPTLNASTVIAGGVPIGVHLTISLEDFESLGLDVHTEPNTLELTGTREEIAAAADLFAKMGQSLQTFLASGPVD